MSNSKKVYLAIDIGASGGRVVAGCFDGQTLRLQDVHRFQNGPMRFQGRMYWDLLALWKEVQDGLRRAADEFGDSICSVGVDTWGVDYGLLGPGEELLGNPRHYRDARTHGIMESVFEVVARRDIFAATGVQFMELNTLFQLAAMRRENPRLLDVAEDFLMIPDLIHWLLTGQKVNELTNATTTQLFDLKARRWATDLLTALNIPDKIFREPKSPGTSLGRLRREVAESTNLSQVQVVVPGTHDTASAVLAVPATGLPSSTPDWCYISSGTWSLLGVEIPQPVINEKCLDLNFTNEGGVGDTVRLLKNIGGLWLVQECRRIWLLQGHEYSWDDMTRMAAETAPLVSFIDPDDSRFTAPQDMTQAIRDYCAETDQPVPTTDASILRCALESLAMRYRLVLSWLEELLAVSRIETIHIVGGGARNQQLCQMTADACNRRVVAGPVEATAIGNAMLQAIAAADVESIAAARQIIGESFAVREYEPQEPHPWDEAFVRFQRLLEA